MMSKKNFFIVLSVFVLYILFGAWFFYYIEHAEETERIQVENDEIDQLKERVNHLIKQKDIDRDFFHSLEKYCGKEFLNTTHLSYQRRKWDFYNSIFFVITVVSTIGYGNLAPTTMLSRIFMIFYGLVGIPMNGIVMVTLGEIFGKSITGVYNKYKISKREKKQDSTRFGLIAQVILYLIPGFTFFIFVPSIFIWAFDGWPYDVAVYYSFVTLTTIGFGDYVAGQKYDTYNDLGEGFLYSVYQIGLLIWIIGGLGYVVMILNFIAVGMRSKKLKSLEHKITQNIMRTPQKIRQELRSLLEDFLLNKVKRVYKEEDFIPHKIERSQSCPNLVLYTESSPSLRRRALSECPRNFIFQRIQSENDLHRIDKEVTFRDTDEQADLLLHLVDALALEQPSPPLPDEHNCYEGFSEEEILASERYGSNLSLGSNFILPFNGPKIKRQRAVSDIRAPYLHRIENNDLTWYGQPSTEVFAKFAKDNRAKSSEVYDNKLSSSDPTLFQKIRNRFKVKEPKSFDVEKQMSNKVSGFSKPRKTSIIDVSDKNFQPRKFSTFDTLGGPSQPRKFSAFDSPSLQRRKFSALDTLEERTRPRRNSIFTPAENKYLNNTRRGRASVVEARQEDVLENTSLADFIRALTALSVPEVQIEEVLKKKKDKSKKEPSVTPPHLRNRRNPIKQNFSRDRRSSLMPNFLSPDLYTPSSSSHSSRRPSLSPVATETGSRATSLRPPSQSPRRFSMSPLTEHFQVPSTSQTPPPPYSFALSNDDRIPDIPAPSKIRRFSVRPTSQIQQNIGAVQRQVFRRDRENSQSQSDNEKL